MDELESARFRIYALEDGAIRAQALAFCLRIGLFDRLEEGALDSGEIGDAFDLSPRVVPSLLAFLASQGPIERGLDGRFGNTQAASVFLVRTSPRYVGGRGLLFQGFYDAIAHLPESLATGKPWTPAGQHDMFGGFGPEEQAWFAEGMFANAVHGARWLLEQVDFRSGRRLLDVGGSTGGYTLSILEAVPALQATIFDLPAVRDLAEQRIRASAASDRVSFVPGSFFTDPLPKGHDMLLLSSVLHDWGDGDCERILKRCFEALEPGGTVVVTEPMLREDYSGPDHPAASGLTMVVLGGENRMPNRICELLESAGFGACWQSEVGAQNSVVTGKKPG